MSRSSSNSASLAHLELALGLGSEDGVSRTWKRQAESRPSEPGSPIQHL